ncbi:MAG TPA: ABC transporter permease [Cytophagales bacterium]|nr:ABC transporter permease [Cytophagales bacterium]
MTKFILKRILYGFGVIFGVLIVVFFIFNVLPGDPVEMMVGQRSDVATREAIQKELGLDKPLSVQLAYYLNDFSPLSVHDDSPYNASKYEYMRVLGIGNKALVLKKPYLRRSFQTNKRVDEIIFDHMEGTFYLSISAMLFATFLGILFGVVSALKPNSAVDYSLSVLSILGISVPSFVAAILMSWVFAVILAEYTGLEVTGSLWEMDSLGEGKHLALKNLLLPTITLGLRPLSIIVQLTRGSMLEVLSQDYIRTAKAKGLRFYKIVLKHALKNALNPVITAVSGWLASLMAGAFFVEMIFNWKGLGLVTINAVMSLDFPVVMGCTVFVAFVFVVINILVDILYAVIDPRVKIK